MKNHFSQEYRGLKRENYTEEYQVQLIYPVYTPRLASESCSGPTLDRPVINHENEKRRANRLENDVRITWLWRGIPSFI
jgi:hypothetical protein